MSRRLTTGVGLALLVLHIGAPITRAEEPTEVSRGALLFKVYCVNCHGESGKGDGPTAEVLVVKPADLTRLRSDTDGEFPTERVYRQIDGRDRVSGHGQSQMPIWGLGFQELDRDTNQEAEVRAKILSLIEYLKSIQEDVE